MYAHGAPPETMWWNVGRSILRWRRTSTEDRPSAQPVRDSGVSSARPAEARERAGTLPMAPGVAKHANLSGRKPARGGCRGPARGLRLEHLTGSWGLL